MQTIYFRGRTSYSGGIAEANVGVPVSDLEAMQAIGAGLASEEPIPVEEPVVAVHTTTIEQSVEAPLEVPVDALEREATGEVVGEAAANAEVPAAAVPQYLAGKPVIDDGPIPPEPEARAALLTQKSLIEILQARGLSADTHDKADDLRLRLLEALEAEGELDVLKFYIERYGRKARG